jgi:hypothetical protein
VTFDRQRGRAIEESLAALLYGDGAPTLALAGHDGRDLDEARAAVRQMVLTRTHRGTGGIRDWFPRTIAAWRAAHPDDTDFAQLTARFLASPACDSWREVPTGSAGVSLEEALHRFFGDEKIGDAPTRDEEFLSAVVRGLAVTPRAQFTLPPSVRWAPGGCYALAGLVLHAAIDGAYLRGPVTPLVAALLGGDSAARAAARLGIATDAAAATREALVQRRLLDRST